MNAAGAARPARSPRCAHRPAASGASREALLRTRGVVGQIAAALVLVAAVAGGAGAHERSVSYSSWVFDERGADVTLAIDGRDLTRLPEAAGSGAAAQQAISLSIATAFAAKRGGEHCSAASSPLRSDAASGRVTLRWRLGCRGLGPVELTSSLPDLLQVAHLAFARIAIAGTESFEVVLDNDRRTWLQADTSRASRASTTGDAFRFGLGHIAGGFDHLCFVFGLVLATATLAEVAMVVTAFTLAHTLTLAAATVGWLRPPAAPVEALIAVSIALLAVENLALRGRDSRAGFHPSLAALLVLLPALLAAATARGSVPLLPLVGTAVFASSYLAFAARRPGERRVRWLVAFAFGLLHGFGFAGALVESGFSTSTVAFTLLSFNAGVETGQLLFVALLWPFLLLARRASADSYSKLVLEPASVLLLAASAAWYAGRAFG